MNVIDLPMFLRDEVVYKDAHTHSHMVTQTIWMHTFVHIETAVAEPQSF